MKVKWPPFHFNGEYFLFLLPLFFVFHGFVANLRLIPIDEALGLCGYYILVSLLVVVVAWIYFWLWRKASLFTTGVMAFHFFFGSLHDLSKAVLGNVFLTRYTFLLCFILVGFVTWIIFLKRSKRSFNRLTRYCNLLLVVLIAIDSFSLLSELFKDRKITAVPPDMIACDTCAKPDIYLIIADEYAGNQELKELFGYDNAPFFTELRKRGFQVKENPRSNYNFTPFSVASILNFDYLPLKNPGQAAPETGMVTEMIKHSRLQQFFQASGYQIFNCSTFDLAGLPAESVDAFLPTKTKFITAQTFVSRLNRDIFFNLITRFKIRWIIKKATYHARDNNKLLYNRTLAAVAQNIHPKFVYTHLSLPHFPYYFNENGKPFPYDSLFEVHNKKQYLSYLKYGNKKYLSLIDFILKHSPHPPLIVLMSDHGYRDYSIQERLDYLFMNICAIYDPYAGQIEIHQKVSNVNLFREILNAHFSQKLPLLRDSTIILKD